MKEYFILNNNYEKKKESVLSNNTDYKLSFLNKKGGYIEELEEEYIEIDEDYLPKKEKDNIYKILNDKKLKKLIGNDYNIELTNDGKIKVGLSFAKNYITKKDLFI